MRKGKFAPAKPVYQPPSQLVWTEDKLAALDNKQLLNLLENLATQRGSGRVAEETADRTRTTHPRPPAVARSRRATQAGAQRSHARGPGRGAARRTGRTTRGALRPQPGNSHPRLGRHQGLPAPGHDRQQGACARRQRRKNGSAAIDRYIACRVRDSLASLAYVLLADRPQESGRYVLLGTSDLFDEEPPPNEFTALAEQHAWSAGSRTRMRAAPMATYAEAAERFEALIARVAPPLELGVATA